MRSRLILFLILLAGLGMRISYLASNPHVNLGAGLVAPQGEMARNIVDHGRWFVVNRTAATYVELLRNRERRLIDPASIDYRALDAHPRWQPEISEPVGEALVIAGVWKLTGNERYLEAQILQIIVDALVALLVYRIALRLFKRPRAALIAGALYALFPPIAWLSTVPNVDIWAVDFTIAIFAAYVEAMRSPHRWRWLIVCGLATGAGSYFRPNVLIIPAVLALATITRSGWRETLRAALIPTAIAGLLLVPWTIRNVNEFHRLIPVRSGLGQNLWEGLGEVHNDFGAVLNDEITYAQVHRVHPYLTFGTPAYDDYLLHKAVRAVKRRPLTYVKAVARRIAISTAALLDTSWMRRGTYTPSSYRSNSLLSYAVNQPLDLLQVAFEPVVLLLAMLGLTLTWRGRRRMHALLIALVLATLIPYLMIHVEPRYVLPATVAYIIWIALGADVTAERLITRLRSQRVNSMREPGAVGVR